MDVEHVLVVPTGVFHGIGLFHGFSPEVERYLPRLLDPAHLRYLARPEAENDPSFKQLIPYIVLRWGEQLFHYRRGQGAAKPACTPCARSASAATSIRKTACWPVPIVRDCCANSRGSGP